MMVTNVTTGSGLLLLGFSDTCELQILQAFFYLVMYLLGLAGNFIIITFTMLDSQLQSSMYYFLRHLALLDISLLSITVPQSIYNSLTGSGYISYAQCVLQVFFFTSLAFGEMAILTVMSYDCYVAICLPLHYEVTMSLRRCRWAGTAVWISGGISRTLYTSTTFSVRFCRAKIIHQFFCDIPQLLKLSCSSDFLGVFGVAAFLSSFAFSSFIAITVSYVQIFSAVFRMPSAEGRVKVFSTCLCVVSFFFMFTGGCEYFKPFSDSPTALDLILAIFYTVLPPELNPIIYSLRNETMKGAVKLLLGRELTQKKKYISVLFLIVV